MLNPETLVIIPAKGFSNRIAKKNLQKINNLTLIEIAFKKMISLTEAKNIVVSSELNEVHDLVRSLGHASNYVRPSYLSEDNYGVVDVVRDVILSNEKRGIYHKNILIILPTSPFLRRKSIVDAESKFLNSGARCLMSVSKDLKSPYHSLYEKSGSLFPLHPESLMKELSGVNEYRTTYKANGAITLLNKNAFLSELDYYLFPLEYVELGWLEGIDIDYPHELSHARNLASEDVTLLDI